MISKNDFIINYANNAYCFQDDYESMLIAKLIYKYLKGKMVLDIGCGPVHHVLIIFLENALETIALDLNRENLNYITNIIHNKKITEIQKSASKYLKRYLMQDKFSKFYSLESIIEKSNNRIKTLKEGNALDLQNDFISKFDNVMQIGCFGALDNLAEFQKAVYNAAQYLVPKGKLLMVNWRQKNSEKIPYNFNGRFSNMISKKVYREAIFMAGLKIIEIKITKKISIESRNDGCDFMIYAVAEK